MLCYLDKWFGYALKMNTAPEGMRLRKSRIQERDGYAEAIEGAEVFFVMPIFPLLAFCGRERGTCMKENGSVSRSIE